MSIPIPADEIFEDLVDQIRTGELAPGQELPTYIDLANHYGVGRTTISTVIKRLRDAGLVVGVRGRGTFVAED